MSEHPATVVGLRVAAVAAAVVAAWGPHLPRGGDVSRVVLVDVSAGCDSRDASGVVGRAVPSWDEAVLVTFADGAVAPSEGVGTPARSWDREVQRGRAAVPGSATDLAAALRLAAVAGGTGDHPIEVLIAGDGRATSSRDELMDAAAGLRSAGCTSLRFVDLPRRPPGDHVAHVRGPGIVRSGGMFAVTVEGVAATASTRVELLRDGSVLGARTVEPGPFRVAFPRRAGRVGEEVYEARVGGRSPERAARAHVVVSAPGRALLIADVPPRGGLREAAGADVDVLPPGATEVSTALATHDVVIVDRAPAVSAQAELAAWVARGGGVVLLDGPESVLRVGGPLAAIAPLRATPPDDPGAFLYVAVDGSGSMAERWPGGSRSRDEIVRSAVLAVLGEQAADVTVVVRRFADALRPVGAGPWTGRPGRDPQALRDAVDGWSPPGGGTLLEPALAEAARLAAARPERVRRALVFSDGRFADQDDALVRAVRAVRAADCDLTLVVDDEEAARTLEALLGDTDAAVICVTEPASLTGTLRSVASPRPHVIEAAVELRLTSAARTVPGLDAPASAAGVVRRFPAADAVTWVVTRGGAPVAAVRRHGEGRVAALATRPADAEYLADSASARALVAALRAAVERRAATDVRVERDGDALLVRAGGTRPTHAEVVADGGARRVPLRIAAEGLLRGTLPAGTEGGLVRLLAGEAELATVGLDRPGAPEHVREREIDRDPLVEIASSGSPRRGAPLRPWTAALAVLALLAAHVVAARGRPSPA